MNLTVRVETNVRSIIVKQSREYVEKFPDVPAPCDRVLSEIQFYDCTKGNAMIRSMTPLVLYTDYTNNVMVMEDLGQTSDYTRYFSERNTIPMAELERITEFAATLHVSYTSKNTDVEIGNQEMKKLSHFHIFVFPFDRKNGLQLDSFHPGLESVAKRYLGDQKLVNEVSKLGERFMRSDSSLLHGDYHLGSFLNTGSRVYVIDTEFCCFGDPEFDMGVMVAHLIMSEQPQSSIDAVLRKYTSIASLDLTLCSQYAGVEIMRRIIGIAQLPLSLQNESRITLLETAYQLILQTKLLRA